jgi:aminoglycoside 6-adenylyltransferase
MFKDIQSKVNDPVIAILLDLAERDDNIRAVLMEGSRAFGNVDKYSDYDIVFVTRNSEPYFNGSIIPTLTEKFGAIAVTQTPDNGDPHDVYTHLIQFASGLRIDLTFNSLAFINRILCESATVVLLDKDGKFTMLPPPSDRDYWINKPSAEEFRYCCNEFWWTAPYVAKAVVRGQTLHALEMLNECVRAEYIKMLSCLAGAETDFSKSVGKHATDIANYVPKVCYDALLKSYPRADLEEITEALNGLMRTFPRIANAVAEKLCFEYDSGEGERAVRFIKEKFLLLTL